MGKLDWSRVSEIDGFEIDGGRAVEKNPNSNNYFKIRTEREGASFVVDGRSSEGDYEVKIKDENGNEEVSRGQSGSVSNFDVSGLGDKLLVVVKSAGNGKVIIDGIGFLKDKRKKQ